jgi:radical SAM superfamily enzyme YgiQ (UPF0313 family)
MKDEKETLFIFPPAFLVDQPYLALPSLIAYLRAKGINNVLHWDCNIEAFWYFLEANTLQHAVDKVRNRRKLLESQFSSIPPNELQEYYRICEVDLVSELVLKNLDAAKTYFCHKTSCSIDEYHFHIRTLSKALSIISTSYYPTEISLYDFNMRFSSQHSRDIFEAASSPENPYIEYFEDKVLPRLLEIKPKLIGISVACMSQIIPSFTLAKMVKSSLPGTSIVFGGQVFNRLIDNIMKVPDIFNFVDYFIVREGETALLQLIMYLQERVAINDVPNLVYFDNNKCQAVANDKFHVEDVALLPLPDFSDLDLSKYLAPQPVLPYQPVRGCYWHRCAFCNHFAIHPPKERAKSPEQVVIELRQLKETYQTPYFTFINESIRPHLLREYADAINRSKLNLEWYVGARLEPEMDTETLSTLKSSGCVKIYFGLETGSQQVLDSMRKGISLTIAQRIFQDCKKFDIAVHLFLMLGFPTEKLEDIRTSAKVVCRLARILPRETFTYYISIYQLKPCSIIFDNLELFNIVSVEEMASKRDLEYLYEFKVADRGGPIEYEAEKNRLEKILDKIKGQSVYPENIIHFLTMRDIFKIDSKPEHDPCGMLPQRYKNALKIREHLAFTKVKVYNSTGRIEEPDKHLIYGYWRDEIFVVDDPIVWNLVKRLSGTIFDDKEVLYKKINAELKQYEYNEDIVYSIVDNLLSNNLLVNANSRY